MITIKYSLYTFGRGIYFLKIPDQYDLCMVFCRYQEYYESGFDQIKGKTFTLSQYQRLYASDKNLGDGSFSYPCDWEGFNVPGWVFDKIYIPDMNEYDTFMYENIIEVINQDDAYKKYRSASKDFYLIGASKLVYNDILNHELAHALYKMHPLYNQEIQELIDGVLPKSLRKILNKFLIKTGYAPEVLDDEIHAYCIGGLDYISDELNESNQEKLNIFAPQICNVFNKFHKELKATLLI